MRSKISVVVVALMAAISIQLAWAADEFTVTKKKSATLGDVTDVSFTSRLDKVQILDVSINRGNCRMINAYGSPVEKPLKPFSMNFGSTVTVGAAGFCNPLEIEIKTDKGTFRTGWEK